MNTEEKRKHSIKKILHIMSKFRNKTATPNHAENLAKILIYENPINSKIVFKTKKKDLKIVTKIIKHKITANSCSAANYHNRVLTLNKEIFQYYGFVDYLLSIGHEFTHYIQDLVSQAIELHKNLALSKVGKNLIEDFNVLVDSYSLKKIMKKYNLIDIDVNDKDLFDQFIYSCYNQLSYEENARKCSFEFAKEVLLALKKEVTGNMLAYIQRCEKILNADWKAEVDLMDKTYYNTRRVFKTYMNLLAKIPFQEILDNKDNDIKIPMICNKLNETKKLNPSQYDYFKVLFQSHLLLDNKFNTYKDINKNIRNLSIQYFSETKDLTIDDLNLLFIYTRKARAKNEKFLTSTDLTHLCANWAKNGNFDILSKCINWVTIVALEKTTRANYKDKKLLKKAFSTKQFSKVYWTLAQDKDIKTITTSKLKELKEKSLETIDSQSQTLNGQGNKAVNMAQNLIKNAQNLIYKQQIKNLTLIDNCLEPGRCAIEKVGKVPTFSENE